MPEKHMSLRKLSIRSSNEPNTVFALIALAVLTNEDEDEDEEDDDDDDNDATCIVIGSKKHCSKKMMLSCWYSLR